MPVLEELPFALDTDTVRRVKARHAALTATAVRGEADIDLDEYTVAGCVWCGNGCMNGCRGSCDGTCSGSCGSGCANSCSGDCSGSRR